MDGLEQVRRRAQAHQVAGPRVVGEQRDDDVEGGVALVGRLVAGKAPDADAIEREAGDEPGRRRAQVRVQPALDDPEDRLISRKGRQRPFRPAVYGRLGDDSPRRLGKTGWSKATAMSDPSASWTAVACSGVNRWTDPSMCDRKVTPSSSTTRRSPSETTWKPPESVRIGRSQSMNRCRPPRVAMRSCPGRRYRW
jgi:hypothetical protein